MNENQRKNSTSEKINIETIITAFNSEMEIYSSALRDNDEKRDQFVRFYFSIVITAIGFCVLTLSNQLDMVDGMIDLSKPIFQLLAIILGIVLLLGMLTFYTLIKCRILHTYYVKLINRNRGYKLKAIASKDANWENVMFNAWHEHISDEFPPFLKSSGLEQAITLFLATINSLLCGIIGVFSCSHFCSTKIQTTNFSISMICIFLFLFSYLIQIIWMRRSLVIQDKIYIPQITSKNYWKPS